jgi:hypothetical protein
VRFDIAKDTTFKTKHGTIVAFLQELASTGNTVVELEIRKHSKAAEMIRAGIATNQWQTANECRSDSNVVGDQVK